MILDTPCVLVDVDRLEKNIHTMAELAAHNRVALRPHGKTHKSVKIAHMQLAAGAKGITVAKVSEAEVMARSGIKDIFIAYPIVGEEKLRRLLLLNRQCRLIVGVDSLHGALGMAKAARQARQQLTVQLEVDIGFARTGAAREDAIRLALDIGRIEGLQLNGIFAFKSLTLAGKPTSDRKAAGLEEGRLMVDLAEKIRSAGMPLQDVSVGSTPTAAYAATVPGITEIRPGTYVFNDMATVASGSCTLEDCAARVCVTVVSRSKDRLVIDGGSKTFSTDSQPGIPPLNLEGFGKIISDDRLLLQRFTEEHGMIALCEGAKPHEVGDQLLIIPNHICTTVNMHNSLTLVKDSRIQEVIPVDARGCVT